MKATLIRILWIVIAAVSAYLGWNLWYYYPVRTKRSRKYQVIKEQN